MATIMGMNTGMALKTAFCESFLKQKSELRGNKIVSHVALAIHARGYKELIKNVNKMKAQKIKYKAEELPPKTARYKKVEKGFVNSPKILVNFRNVQFYKSLKKQELQSGTN